MVDVHVRWIVSGALGRLLISPSGDFGSKQKSPRQRFFWQEQQQPIIAPIIIAHVMFHLAVAAVFGFENQLLMTLIGEQSMR